MSSSESHTLRILVVDDNREIQKFLTEVFTTWGPFHGAPAQVSTASGVTEAREALESGTYDLVVLDMVLGDGNGLQILETIRGMKEHPHVIVVSADDPADLRRKATEMGASAFLRKGEGVEAIVREAVALLEVRAPQPWIEESGPQGDATGRVLVVDDDPLVSDALASMMELIDDVEVKTASGGSAGLAIAREWHPHVILLDIAMPDMDGRQTLRSIMETGLRCRVIMVSAFRDSDVARECVELGAADYIPKPVDFPFLKRTVQGHLALAKKEALAE